MHRTIVQHALDHLVDRVTEVLLVLLNAYAIVLVGRNNEPNVQTSGRVGLISIRNRCIHDECIVYARLNARGGGSNIG